MACEEHLDALGELADGTLGPIRRAALQTHLDVCDACRALAADLQKIRSAAGSLDPVEPPPQVWLQIAAQLRHEGRVANVAPVRHRQYAMLAIAATLLLAVGGALYLLIPGRTTTAPASAGTAAPASPTAAGNAATDDLVQSVAEDVGVAEQHFLSAISKLEAVSKADPEALQPDMVAGIKQGNAAVNQAITESAEALQRDPQSGAARETYFQALRQKVTLLQNTIALLNEMRKGNSAAAAVLVDEANKS